MKTIKQNNMNAQPFRRRLIPVTVACQGILAVASCNITSCTGFSNGFGFSWEAEAPTSEGGFTKAKYLSTLERVITGGNYAKSCNTGEDDNTWIVDPPLLTTSLIRWRDWYHGLNKQPLTDFGISEVQHQSAGVYARAIVIFD